MLRNELYCLNIVAHLVIIILGISVGGGGGGGGVVPTEFKYQ